MGISSILNWQVYGQFFQIPCWERKKTKTRFRKKNLKLVEKSLHTEENQCVYDKRRRELEKIYDNIAKGIKWKCNGICWYLVVDMSNL